MLFFVYMFLVVCSSNCYKPPTLLLLPLHCPTIEQKRFNTHPPTPKRDISLCNINNGIYMSVGAIMCVTPVGNISRSCDNYTINSFNTLGRYSISKLPPQCNNIHDNMLRYVSIYSRGLCTVPLLGRRCHPRSGWRATYIMCYRMCIANCG